MSAGATGAIGPVSARYAAQIRELLHVQAVQRMAADQEAARARAEADRDARAEAAARASRAREPLNAKVDATEPAPLPAPVKPPEAPAEQQAAPTLKAPAKLIDIQA